MKYIALLCAVAMFMTGIGCSAPDRETFMKRQIKGTWNSESFGGVVQFKVTDSTFYVPHQEIFFHADRYSISPLDSISLCTPNDTIVLKLVVNKRADTMWLVNNQYRAEFVRVE